MRSNNVYLFTLLCLLHLTYFRKWCHLFTKSLIKMLLVYAEKLREMSQRNNL